ncbi:glycoside hydrolase family 19 protein [Paraburkholderia humisilvae]|uniref:glycoside hydrolase family 19 protein n=3 Tax=Paraburkholderia humisilvae TaxID=627669 RepID=UPI0036206195
MHMADWKSYLEDGRLARPDWWLGVDAYRVAGRDRQKPDAQGNSGDAAGAFVYTEPKAGHTKGQFSAGTCVAFLPKDSEVIVGEKRGEWRHIKAVTSGTMTGATHGSPFGTKDLTVPWQRPDGDDRGRVPLTPEGDWGWLHLHDEQPVREPEGVGSVVIPPRPVAVKAGTLMGQIGQYLDYERSTPLPPKPARELLHLEVFAGEAFAAFLAKSRARAAQLPASERTILLVQPGATLAEPMAPDTTIGRFTAMSELRPTKDSPATGPWVKVQPFFHSTGSTFLAPYYGPVWVERRHEARFRSPNGLAAWNRFPLQVQGAAGTVNDPLMILPRAQLDGFEGGNRVVDDQGVHWWQLQVINENGERRSGWVCEKDHPGTKWESPWAWPGFEIVDATGIRLTDMFLRNLSVTDSADWQEKREFAPSTEAVNGSALLLRLEQTVARLPAPGGNRPARGEDGREVVTAVKLQRAMDVPGLASELAHVVLRYESEWGGNMARWEAITPLMRNARVNWECELERVGKLQWWDQVKGKVEGFPDSPVVHHIHPVALVGNFQSTPFLCPHCRTDLTISAANLIEIFPQILDADAAGYATALNYIFSKYKIDTCNRISHFLGQCAVECAGFTAFKEVLNYREGDHLWNTYSGPLKRGLNRLHPDWTATQIEKYAKTNLVYNDKELGIVLFGDNAYPGRDYRGRGLIHVTWLENYRHYTEYSGVDVVADPERLEYDRPVAADSAGWFWSTHVINQHADANNPKKVTAVINPALKELNRRRVASQRAFTVVNKGGEPCRYNWETTITSVNGW